MPKKKFLDLILESYIVVFGEEPPKNTTPLINMAAIFDALGHMPATEGLVNQAQEAANILGLSPGEDRAIGPVGAGCSITAATAPARPMSSSAKSKDDIKLKLHKRLEQNRISVLEARKPQQTMQRSVITLSRENKELKDRKVMTNASAPAPQTPPTPPPATALFEPMPPAAITKEPAPALQPPPHPPATALAEPMPPPAVVTSASAPALQPQPPPSITAALAEPMPAAALTTNASAPTPQPQLPSPPATSPAEPTPPAEVITNTSAPLQAQPPPHPPATAAAKPTPPALITNASATAPQPPLPLLLHPPATAPAKPMPPAPASALQPPPHPPATALAEPPLAVVTNASTPAPQPLLPPATAPAEPMPPAAAITNASALASQPQPPPPATAPAEPIPPPAVATNVSAPARAPQPPPHQPATALAAPMPPQAMITNASAPAPQPPPHLPATVPAEPMPPPALITNASAPTEQPHPQASITAAATRAEPMPPPAVITNVSARAPQPPPYTRLTRYPPLPPGMMNFGPYYPYQPPPPPLPPPLPRRKAHINILAKEDVPLVPNKNDVLCVSCGLHQGNSQFGCFVAEKKSWYLRAETARERAKIELVVLQQIRALKPPGRFISQNSPGSPWYELTVAESLQVVTQSFQMAIGNLGYFSPPQPPLHFHESAKGPLGELMSEKMSDNKVKRKRKSRSGKSGSGKSGLPKQQRKSMLAGATADCKGRRRPQPESKECSLSASAAKDALTAKTAATTTGPKAAIRADGRDNRKGNEENFCEAYNNDVTGVFAGRAGCATKSSVVENEEVPRGIDDTCFIVMEGSKAFSSQSNASSSAPLVGTTTLMASREENGFRRRKKHFSSKPKENGSVVEDEEVPTETNNNSCFIVMEEIMNSPAKTLIHLRYRS